jgi:K+-sensing histidine kinase KdpD
MESVEGDPGLQALKAIRHDFKTPLTSLRMLGQIFKLSLEKGTFAQQPERTERNCRMLIEQVDKLVELADDLYEISIVQSGRLQLDRQLSDLRPVIESAMDRYRARVTLLDMPQEPVWGEWDTGRMLQAISHLISELETVAIVVNADAKNNVARIELKGTPRVATTMPSPARYVAGVVIEKHGGKIEGCFEITLPMKS